MKYFYIFCRIFSHFLSIIFTYSVKYFQNYFTLKHNFRTDCTKYTNFVSYVISAKVDELIKKYEKAEAEAEAAKKEKEKEKQQKS